MLRFDNKTAIVTGSARGIGAETIRAFARQGANVVVSDLREDEGNALVERLKADGKRAIFVRCDVSNRDEVKTLMDRTIAEFGQIDVLVNNAGFNKDFKITDMKESDWDSVLDVCLKGAFNCCQFAAPHMLARKYGKIVNVSSRGYLGNPGQANYAAAKAGMVGLALALAKELGRHNINVNVVAPGFTDTDFVKVLPTYEMIKERALQAQSIKRAGTTGDQANAILFLASDEASFINGEIIHVTGGRYA
jgi:3-oxoacyl-[acyl-carrier protein] reductase